MDPDVVPQGSRYFQVPSAERGQSGNLAADTLGDCPRRSELRATERRLGDKETGAHAWLGKAGLWWARVPLRRAGASVQARCWSTQWDQAFGAATQMDVANLSPQGCAPWQSVGKSARGAQPGARWGAPGPQEQCPRSSLEARLGWRACIVPWDGVRSLQLWGTYSTILHHPAGSAPRRHGAAAGTGVLSGPIPTALQGSGICPLRAISCRKANRYLRKLTGPSSAAHSDVSEAKEKQEQQKKSLQTQQIRHQTQRRYSCPALL